MKRRDAGPYPCGCGIRPRAGWLFGDIGDLLGHSGLNSRHHFCLSRVMPAAVFGQVGEGLVILPTAGVPWEEDKERCFG